VATPGLDPNAEAKAREALHEKIANGEGQATTAAPSPLPVATPPQYVNPPQAAPTPAVTPAPAPVAAVPASVVAAPAAIVAAPVAPPVTSEAVPVANRPDSEAEARAREALRQKMQELSGAPVGAASPTYGVTPPITTPTQPPKKDQNIAFTTPRPLATGSKERRLDDLLRLYKADQITPQEYHVQRAKIIAEP
jgi:hypothetical protein